MSARRPKIGYGLPQETRQMKATTDGMASMKTVFVTLLTILFLVFGTSILPAGSHSLVVTPHDQDIFAGINLPVYVWSNGRRPDAIVVGLHGGCLHGRAYDHLARVMNADDILFVSLDLRGYGSWYHENFGTKKDRTFNYTQSRKDVEVILKRLREVYPGTPIFAIGESVGANMAIVVAADEPRLLDGIVLVSPSSAIRFFMSPEMIYRGVRGVSLPFGKVSIKGVLKNRLANRAEIAEEHLSDPLGRDYQSVPELLRSWRLNLKAMRDARKIPSGMPVLVFIGSQDLLCNTKMTVVMFDQLKSQDKELIVLPDSGHLMVETAFASPRTIKLISSWILRQHDAKSTAFSETQMQEDLK